MGLFGTVVTTALTIAAQRNAAAAEKIELKIAGREEASAARDREILRRRRTATILGKQSADAAAKGIQSMGSVANISIVDAERAREESLIDRVNTGGRIDALNRRSRSVGRLQKIRTATTIFKAVEDTRERGKTPSGGK